MNWKVKRGGIHNPITPAENWLIVKVAVISIFADVIKEVPDFTKFEIAVGYTRERRWGNPHEKFGQIKILNGILKETVESYLQYWTYTLGI